MKHPCTKTLCLAVIGPLLASSGLAQSSSAPSPRFHESWWDSLPNEDKALYVHAAAAGFITLYGVASWDYGSTGFHGANEGWFGEDTKYGGADKTGHFWSTYVLSDALSGLYGHWGMDSASSYGAFSAWIVQAVMELEDATSVTQGFDWGDMTMNTVGALTSMLLARYPDLDRKLDFRVEYAFNVPVNGIFDDYSNQCYAMAVKLAGFDSLENTWLQWIELQGGYYSRGYDSPEVAKERDLYIGITFNFSRALHRHGHHKAGTVLEYLQIPYSVPKLSRRLS